MGKLTGVLTILGGYRSNQNLVVAGGGFVTFVSSFVSFLQLEVEYLDLKNNFCVEVLPLNNNETRGIMLAGFVFECIGFFVLLVALLLAYKKTEWKKG